MKAKPKKKAAKPAPRASSVSPERLRWLDQQLAELTVACPWANKNPLECPLCNVRKLPTSAVADWLARLTPEEKEYLILYHQCCLAIKWENEVLQNP
jgi:hypothetical protein